MFSWAMQVAGVDGHGSTVGQPFDPRQEASSIVSEKVRRDGLYGIYCIVVQDDQL